MAIKRTSSNSISNAVKLSTGFASAAIPNTPTIGTATATSDVAATVTYTAAVLGATGSTFIATSNPGSVTGTGSSPITVTGLTASTSYTFSVTAGNANGTSAASSASNSITTSAPLNSYESIATVTVGSAQSTITFSAIPSTYKHLQLRYIARATNSATFGNIIWANFNNDTTTGNYYAVHRINGRGDGTVTALASSGSGQSWAGLVAGGGTIASNFTPGIIDILDYASTSKNKTIRTISGLSGQTTSTENDISFMSSLYFPSTIAAINEIDLTVSGTNFAQYSSFALYGIKA